MRARRYLSDNASNCTIGRAAHGASDVPEGVRPLVAVFRGVRKLAGTHGIEHDDTRPRHAGYSRSAMLDVLGLIGMFIFCACVIALAAAVTGLVVRLSPSKKPNSN